jgi:hypothetical protein
MVLKFLRTYVLFFVLLEVLVRAGFRWYITQYTDWSTCHAGYNDAEEGKIVSITREYYRCCFGGLGGKLAPWRSIVQGSYMNCVCRAISGVKINTRP